MRAPGSHLMGVVGLERVNRVAGVGVEWLLIVHMPC